MKKKELITTLIHDAARSRAEKNSPAGKLYGDLCGDLDSWCRQQQRHKDMRYDAFAAVILAAISLSSTTAMASRLPDCKMTVSVPFQQEAMYDLSSEIIKQL